jgi:hypothetical protein
MYEAKIQHPLSPPLPTLPEKIEKAMWDLFVAIGPAWEFDDDVESYRLRFHVFLQNRLAIYPFYAAYYEAMANFIADLASQKNLKAAYDLIFFGNNPYDLEYSQELLLSVLQKHVSFEFINFRLACGSFRVWGAINYIDYFGGANLKDEPAPYRTAKGLKP